MAPESVQAILHLLRFMEVRKEEDCFSCPCESGNVQDRTPVSTSTWAFQSSRSPDGKCSIPSVTRAFLFLKTDRLPLHGKGANHLWVLAHFCLGGGLNFFLNLSLGRPPSTSPSTTTTYHHFIFFMANTCPLLFSVLSLALPFFLLLLQISLSFDGNPTLLHVSMAKLFRQMSSTCRFDSIIICTTMKIGHRVRWKLYPFFVRFVDDCCGCSGWWLTLQVRVLFPLDG